MSKIIDLNGTWSLTWSAHQGENGVPECNSAIDGAVPGDVHQDLVRAGVLPEPLVGANAPKHEWVERAIFKYEREFTVDSDFDRAELVFHGVDCIAEVFVDSQKVGESANAFVPHVFDVSAHVKPGNTHQLRVTVDTGVHWAKQQDRSRYINDDNPERMFLRKSQFSFHWDWAPRLVTCGIWRSVELKLHKSAVIRDVKLTPAFDSNSAVLNAAVEIESFTSGEFDLILQAAHDGQEFRRSEKIELAPGVDNAEIELKIDQLRRWFPVGYGDQSLYDIEVTLERAGDQIDQHRTTYGFREVSVKQEPLGDGENSFIINVNGIDVFCKGANWVPADSICARVTDEKYESLVKEAVEANFNMFRIWGGGIYESKAFYDLCDRLGVMIWHDFMFACSEYPDDQQWFVDNVADEARKVVRVLRDHPCIAIWCGNNENDWIYGFVNRGKSKKFDPSFYGHRIYSQVLPEVCAELDPQRPYWQSSPFGGDDPNCEELGDRHAWNVSILEKNMAKRSDITNYRADRGKFSSEFGMMSYALPRTILDYTQDGRIDFNSEAYKVHDNTFNQGLTDAYLKTGFGSVPEDEHTYIMQSLAYQAMGYRESISHFRMRKFGCAGSLFWMYSDCWGTLGWTIIDYYLRRKPSFYWVKKAYAPVAVFVRVADGVCRSYVVNDTLSELPVSLTVEVGELSGEAQLSESEIVVPANGVAEGPSLDCGKGYAFAQIEQDEQVISDDTILTCFPRDIQIPRVNLDFETRQAGDDLDVTVTSGGFGHLVYLDLPDGAQPSDNYFNLRPGRPKTVRVSGITPDQVKLGALNATLR